MRHPWRQRLAAAVLGALVLLLALELGLRAVALGFSLRQRSFDPELLHGKESLTVLCIGESTTAMGGQESWPAQLEGLLQERLPSRRVAVINSAIPGVDSSVLLAQLEPNLDRHHPDIVAAMMGANDTWTGAIPWDETPMAQRPAQLSKTWKLAKQLLHERRIRRPVEADYGPLEARRWIKVEGARREPQSDGSLRDRLTLSRARALAAKGDLDGASGVLHTAVQRRPGSARLREELGVVLRASGRLDLAETYLQEAHRLDSTASSVLVELAAVAADRATQRADETAGENLARTEQLLRQAIALTPDHLEATRRLAFQLRNRGAPEEAIALIEGAPGPRVPEDGLDDLLGEAYRDVGRTREAAVLLRRRLALRNDACDPGWITLTAMLFELGQGDDGEALARWIEEGCEDSMTTLFELAMLLERHGAADHAAAVDARREELERASICPLTHRSYERLSVTLGERGILLVAVQYPRQPVSGLLRHLEPGPGVVLVDNERAFDDAVDTEGYDAMFVDRCYGEFGHATPRGNHLLAEQVAEAIVGALGER
ncbi:MAG: GDSL-type esterase/lipase family protein [Pseudomonadota bacterium]